MNNAAVHWKGLFEAQQAEAVKGNDVGSGCTLQQRGLVPYS